MFLSLVSTSQQPHAGTSWQPEVSSLQVYMELSGNGRRCHPDLGLQTDLSKDWLRVCATELDQGDCLLRLLGLC